jgi:hypothetical protein
MYQYLSINRIDQFKNLCKLPFFPRTHSQELHQKVDNNKNQGYFHGNKLRVREPRTFKALALNKSEIQ